VGILCNNDYSHIKASIGEEIYFLVTPLHPTYQKAIAESQLERGPIL
jgi:hypothetical protein